jgi:tetratricopeptide (TPR) repeat protein
MRSTSRFKRKKKPLWKNAALVALLGLGVAGAVFVPPWLARQAYEEGALAYSKGDIAAAQKALDKSISLLAGNPAAYALRANTRQKAGMLDGALADANRAVEFGPGQAEAWLARARTLCAKKEYAAALPDCDKAVELDPRLAEAWYQRGLVHAALEKYQEAVADHSREIALTPGNAMAYNNRGIALRLAGNPDKAISDFNQAARLSPGLNVVYFNRGLAWFDKKEFERAALDFTKTLELHPFPGAYIHRAQALLNLGRGEEGLSGLEEALERFPGNTDLMRAKAALLAALGRADEARETALEAEKSSPGGGNGEFVKQVEAIAKAAAGKQALPPGK